MTDERAEIIGVVDSDYQLDRGFLRRCAPLLMESWLGFTQAPQDYRGWERARYYRRLYYSYKYFFAVSQPSRNERDGAIFAGTMGLIRRVALEQLGGWDEWCITEDAELSLRLLRAGWTGQHIDQSYGKGIMPLTFEALKGQRYRWCFGGIQILRMHWRSMMPGRQSKENRLTGGQRWAYLSGAVQWYGDLLGLVFLVFLLAGAVNLATGGGELFRKLTPFLVATVPVLVLLGLVRAVALLRRGTGASWRDALGAFFIWQSTSLVVARASILGLFAKKAAFLRTPKTSEKAKWWEAFRANWAESTLALLGFLGIAAGLTKATELAGPLLAACCCSRPSAWRRRRSTAGPRSGRRCRRTWRGPHDGVEAQPAPPDVRPQCGARRAGHGLRRGDRRAVAAAAGPHPRADPEPGRADHEADRVADPEPDPVTHAEPHTVAHAEPDPVTDASPTPSPTPTPTPTPTATASPTASP